MRYCCQYCWGTNCGRPGFASYLLSWFCNCTSCNVLLHHVKACNGHKPTSDLANTGAADVMSCPVMSCNGCKLTDVCECRCCRCCKQGWGCQGQPAGSCQQCRTGVEKQQIILDWLITLLWLQQLRMMSDTDECKLNKNDTTCWSVAFRIFGSFSCKTVRVELFLTHLCVIGLSVQSVRVQLPSGMMLTSQCWWSNSNRMQLQYSIRSL